MKKINYLLLGAAGLLLASCSNEELVNPNVTGDGNYHVTVSIPNELGTRAMNDGLSASVLQYAVYDTDNNNTIVETGTAQFGTDDQGSLSTVVNLKLANGITYAISFFAQSSASQSANVYDYSPSDGTLTVNYANMTNSDFLGDKLDCFVNLLNTGKIGTSDVTTSVILYRPMAQINWGTNDLHAVNAETGAATTNVASTVEQYFGAPQSKNVNYPLPYIQSTLTTKAYNTFSLLNNEVDTDSELVNVTLANFTQPVQANGQLVTFPVNGYRYVACNYLLAPKAGSYVYDLNLNINNGNVTSDKQSASMSVNYDVEVLAAPVQANFKTNIYGGLLTDNVQVTVTKSQYFAGANQLPQDEYDKGDQVNDVGLYYNSSLNIYTITDTDGLEYLAGNITLKSGITVVLANNLDMTNVPHTPFNLNGASFNGGGNIISNLKVEATGRNSAGFFASAQGYVQNLNFTDAIITGEYKAGVVAGDGLCAHIDNCTVTGATVTTTPWQPSGSGNYDDANNVGGIVGYLSAEGAASVTNCSVSGATITAYRKVGGLVGYAGGYNNGNQLFITNNTVSNTTVIANQDIEGTYDGAPRPYSAGEIVGEIAVTGANFSGNTPLNVIVKTISSEGVTSSNVASQDALQTAISEAAEGETINLAPGSYTFPAVSDFKNPNIIIDCADGVEFTGATQFGAYGINGATVKNATFSNSTGNALGGYLDGNFVDCVFSGSNGTRYTYLSGNSTFTGCTFEGTGVYAFHVDSAVNHNYPGQEISLEFTDCYFDGFVAMGASVPLTYNSCTFVINSSSKYGGGNFYGSTTFNSCKFYLPQPKVSFQYIALATAGTTYTFNNCTNNGETITVDFDFAATSGAIVDCDGTTKTL